MLSQQGVVTQGGSAGEQKTEAKRKSTGRVCFMAGSYHFVVAVWREKLLHSLSSGRCCGKSHASIVPPVGATWLRASAIKHVYEVRPRSPAHQNGSYFIFLTPELELS